LANRTSLTPRGALIVGLLFAACGVAPILSGLGAIPLRPTPGTPGWVAVCAGLLFVLGGAAVINGYAIGGAGSDGDFPADTPFVVRLVQYLVGLAIVGLMTAISGWIAFGPGPRQISTTIAMPFFGHRSDDDLSGRIGFGVATVLLAAAFVVVAWSGARGLRRIGQARRPDRPAV
jgi:hypothetical protein